VISAANRAIARGLVAAPVTPAAAAPRAASRTTAPA
jgi:hypothetical protein